MDKWRSFALLNNLTTEQFENEIIDAAQAVLAMKLVRINRDYLSIKNTQNDGVYKLTFERIDE